MQRNINKGRVNIAVIGAGTGLTSAWALEIQKQFNVDVFEAQERLGGHIHTVELNKKKVEVGAEYIGDKNIYPNTHQLFNMLGVTLEPFELNMTFHHLDHPEFKIVLPPVIHTSKGNMNEIEKENKDNAGCHSSWSLFSNAKNQPQNHHSDTKKKFKNQNIQPDIHIDFNTMTKDIRELINLYLVIEKANNELSNLDTFMTLEQFINNFIANSPDFYKRNEFAEQFLYAMIAAGWGVSIDAAKKFNAKYAMHYLQGGKTWFDAPDGLSAYIQNMELACTQTVINKNVKITKLVPVLRDGRLKYQLLCDGGRYIEDKNGEPAYYDDVIITTPAYVSHELIADINIAHIAELIEFANENERNKILEFIREIEALHELLKQVEYFDTTIVFHQDPHYECHPNTVIYTRFDHQQASNTSCKRWKYGADETPILKSWVLPGQTMPNNVLYEAHYRHPFIDERYYNAQQALHRAQRKLCLHFGGILSGASDAHESGITVSLEVAAQLCLRENCLNENPRLAYFPNVINGIIKSDKTQQIDNTIIEATSNSSVSLSKVCKI